jgi:hypothetical protein
MRRSLVLSAALALTACGEKTPALADDLVAAALRRGRRAAEAA